MTASTTLRLTSQPHRLPCCCPALAAPRAQTCVVTCRQQVGPTAASSRRAATSICSSNNGMPAWQQGLSQAHTNTHHQSFIPNATTSTSLPPLSAAAAAAAARPDGADEKGKGSPQPIRTSNPCDKPLPLANTLEVQRLLYLMEAPDYCMRSFREHGVNGQDLLCMREEDMDDSRFKFPKHVARKVLRIAQAWRTFQSITGSPTQGAMTMPEYVAYYSYGRSHEAQRQLEAAYRMVDVNSNGVLTFEEFLVGFSLLDAAVAESRRPGRHDPTASWFQL